MRRIFPNIQPKALWGLLLPCLVALLVACGSPRERYRTLSYFFDGVPDPDAPPKQVMNDGVMVPVIARVVKQHPPFRDNKCAACHQGPNGELQDFALAYNACVKCHKTIASEHVRMHGPVAREACKWCHTPHESAEPALLKADPVKVCTQCHDKQLLGAKPAEHLDGKTSCLNCHSGHGGTARYFLKSATQPAAAPAGKMQTLQPRESWFGWEYSARTPGHGFPSDQSAPAQVGKELAP